MSRVYLDYNASTPLCPAARAALLEALELCGNASSVHAHGRSMRKFIEEARESVAALAHVRPQQVIFTSGATEANNCILSGFRDRRVLIGATEHSAVLNVATQAEHIPVGEDGVLDLAALEDMLAKGETALVSVQAVNSETGVIQPLAEIAALARRHGALIHSDAVQAAGRFDLDFTALDLDYMSLSAHKIYGPQGVGAIIFKSGLQIPPFMRGGGQERRQRAGTENVAGIAGFGAAAAQALDDMADYARLEKLRDHMEAELAALCPALQIHGRGAPRAANTSNIGLPGVPAQTQLMTLDLDGFSVSSGSACSSGAFKPSHVLLAMGVPEDEAGCAIRVSLGHPTSEEEVRGFIAAWGAMHKRLQAQVKSR